MSDPKQFVGERGVLAFDGQVVETFGFGRDPSIRFHVAFLTEVNVDEGGRFSDPSVSFKSSKQVAPMEGIFTAEELKSRELTELLDAVRSAAPNLKEGG